MIGDCRELFHLIHVIIVSTIRLKEKLLHGNSRVPGTHERKSSNLVHRYTAQFIQCTASVHSIIRSRLFKIVKLSKHCPPS